MQRKIKGRKKRRKETMREKVYETQRKERKEGEQRSDPVFRVRGTDILVLFPSPYNFLFVILLLPLTFARLIISPF